jgi:hypothetical protein
MRVLVCLFRTCFLPLGIGSHLSPDGGGFSLSQSTAWDVSVATCRQTVEDFPYRSPPLGSGWLRSVAASVATCRQTVEAFSLAQSTAWDVSVATCRQTVEDFPIAL